MSALQILSKRRYAKRYLREQMDKWQVKKPRTMNLLINDICNSKCKMCNIWKQKRDMEISPSELDRVLDDPLYSELKYVGVSGGEPTLRNDMPAIIEVIANKPGIRSIGIITNAIQADRIIKKIDACAAICALRNINFNVMESLDGIGDVHDFVRGRKGNYDSAMKVIEHIRNREDIALNIGCTVVKENVWAVDEVLEFCQKEKIYGRFRIAEFIGRLYNDDLTESIRSFNEDERYQLALFFYKLEYEYEENENVKRTYANIREMVYSGKKRQSGCPYQINAITMDCRGNLLYCSPKSPIIGSCIEESAIDLYKDNISIRKDIIRNDCDSCIHDYHAPPSLSDILNKKSISENQKFHRLDHLLQKSCDLKSAEQQKLDWKKFKTILITGWYGTETSGDKAILAGLLNDILSANSQANISIASLNPFITERTLKEIGYQKMPVIHTWSDNYKRVSKESDAVVIGGGPLMHIDALGILLSAFMLARKAGKTTIIAGCGIGPLNKDKHVETVKEILRLANVVQLRDDESVEWVASNTQQLNAVKINDPAINYLMRIKPTLKRSNDNLYINCFFRELTCEYMEEGSTNSLSEINASMKKQLSALVTTVKQKTSWAPRLLPMHTFTVGQDDRAFNRQLFNEYLTEVHARFDNRIHTLNSIITMMLNSRFNICMRYHSVVFADVLGVPYIAIDYTGGGKIKAYLKDRGKLDRMLSLEELLNGDWQDKINTVLTDIKTTDKAGCHQDSASM